MNRNAMLTPTSFLSMQEDFHQEDGHSSDLDQKKKWYSTCNERQQGEWDRVAESMMIRFGESAHPFFRATSPPIRGTLKSKGGGKLSARADGETIETVFAQLFLLISSVSTEQSRERGEERGGGGRRRGEKKGRGERGEGKKWRRDKKERREKKSGVRVTQHLSTQLLHQTTPARHHSDHANRDAHRVGALAHHHPGWCVTRVGPGRTPTVHPCLVRQGGRGWLYLTHTTMTETDPSRQEGKKRRGGKKRGGGKKRERREKKGRGGKKRERRGKKRVRRGKKG